ncbi:MAG: aminoglycoside phosphotransferase family protein [Myxococcales bacterium]|nr:aminoglycoside phosphotransferase family protein [Myxococcales bacterium]
MLPQFTDTPAYIAGRGAPEIAEGAAALAERHGVRGPLRRATLGFNPVFLGDDAAIKLYAPPYVAYWELEREALEWVGGRLPVAIPELRVAGELEGWRYAVLARVPGRPAWELWPQLDAAGRERLVAELGALAAAIHDVSLAGCPSRLVLDWPAYLGERRAAALQKHRDRGLDEAWVAAIAAFVAGLPPIDTWPSRQVLLHNDLHLDHVHVDGDGRVVGLLDFGDVQVGAAEVEFASVGGFLAPLLPTAASTFLRAYGYADAALTPELARRLTGHVLLHRYCDVAPLLRRFPEASRPRDLEALHRRLWDFAA